MASATGLFNQRDCDWDWDFVEQLGISPDTLPEIKTQLARHSRMTLRFVGPRSRKRDSLPSLAMAQQTTSAPAVVQKIRLH